MNDYMFLSESFGGTEHELKPPSGLLEMTDAEMDQIGGNCFNGLKHGTKHDLLIGVKPTNEGSISTSALSNGPCHMQHHLMPSPKPLTSPKQIDDLGILFGQLSPVRKSSTSGSGSGSGLGSEPTADVNGNGDKSQAFPISPRPPHGSKRRLCPRNGSTLLSNLYPRTPTLKVKSEFVINMDPMSFQKTKDEDRFLKACRKQQNSWPSRDKRGYSLSLNKRIEIENSEPIVDHSVSRDVSFSTDEISFLGTLLLDPSGERRLAAQPLSPVTLHPVKSEHPKPKKLQEAVRIEKRTKKSKTKQSSQRAPTKRKNKRSTWTPEEDKRLKEEVNLRSNRRYYGMWKEIALSIGGKHTHKECHDRYTKNLDPNLNKGRWKREEDEHLRRLLSLPEMKSSNGDYKWPAIARKLKRCPKQVREHFQNSVDPHLTKRRQPWSEKQVVSLKSLMQAMETQGRGRRWKEIAAEFPGRSVDAVRAKGLSLLETTKPVVTTASSGSGSEETESDTEGPASEIPAVKTEALSFEEIMDLPGFY